MIDVTSPVETTDPVSLDGFLASVERKAYRMALIAVGQHDDALDLVQDSMVKLASSYADKPAQQWKPLFYRILQNRIMDWHRHQKVRNLVFFWRQGDDHDMQDYPTQDETHRERPEGALQKQQQQHQVMDALRQLPAKQQQCFLLRSWEGMSVAETATIMGCSEGSVKTHYSRAVGKLRTLLDESHDVKI